MLKEQSSQHQEIKENKTKFIKFPLYMVIFILIGLIFGYLTFKVLSFSRTVVVPDICGKSLMEAKKILQEQGLYLEIKGEDYNSTFPKGYISEQDIPAGNKVNERKVIKVIVSKGPRVKSIPLIVNETLSNAESILRHKGLKITQIIRVHSDVIEKGRIIAQNPRPHERLNDHITVIVSMGSYEKNFFCPDFRGMYLEQAKSIAKELNLNVSIKGSGIKIEKQKPKPNTEIKSGDTIFLKTIEGYSPFLEL